MLELNRRFYDQFASDFARTRRSYPPGFTRILPYLRFSANVVDMGCGNGRLLLFLAEKGWRGHYLGVDSNQALLDIAAGEAAEHPGPVSRFMRAELLSADATTPPRLADVIGAERWDAVTALAVLHHIPGESQRAALLMVLAEALRPDGLMILSTWQFLGAARLNARILPWARAGIKPDDVEPVDFLLAWGEHAAGLRYCAAIGEDELGRLAQSAGLIPVATFYSDGHEGNLNLYGVFRKVG